MNTCLGLHGIGSGVCHVMRLRILRV